jgi:hypothetical protein
MFPLITKLNRDIALLWSSADFGGLVGYKHCVPTGLEAWSENFFEE